MADYNAYKDFHDREFEAHVTASFMTYAGMETMEDDPKMLPLPNDCQSQEQKKSWFQETLSSYLDHFVFGSSEVSYIVQQVEKLEQNAAGGYPCRAAECNKTYQFHSGRVRHEIAKHPELSVPDTGPSDEMDSEGYYKCRASCGLVYQTKATRN
ncbi:uncharacterized protein [Montipora foliosa]|uniref:uncharacterized protein n=1 Tax=Montipora foliosa TaxID=591990 RepID=UPI0035F11791